MVTKNKFILFSVFAVVIGVSSILPLGYFSTATVKAETEDAPWFSVSLPYSYWHTENEAMNASWFPLRPFLNETEAEQYGMGIILNYTLVADMENQVDARIEYFRIEFSSDKEVIKNIFAWIGTRRDTSIEVDFQFSREGWFNTSKMSGGGLLIHSWAKGYSKLWPSGSGGSGPITQNSEVAKIRAAETAYVSIYRLGWVTLSENSTIVKRVDNELVETIQLERHGEGWLYNNLISEDDLPSINLKRPLDYFD
jgi:hypothetical protein